VRKCMKCGTTYENDCKFCAIDGERLVLVTEETPAPVSDPAQNQQPEQPVAPAPEPDPVQSQQLEQPVAPAPVPDPVQNEQLEQPVAPAPEPDPVQNEQLEQPVAPAPVLDPVQNEQPEQPVESASVPDPVQNQQLPEQANQKQDSSAGPYNYGMTVIEKAVVGVLIGIIAMAIILGILFITGVLGGK